MNCINMKARFLYMYSYNMYTLLQGPTLNAIVRTIDAATNYSIYGAKNVSTIYFGVHALSLFYAVSGC
jgi:hypothetical protein